jgi:hypothetical protein
VIYDTGSIRFSLLKREGGRRESIEEIYPLKKTKIFLTKIRIFSARK